MKKEKGALSFKFGTLIISWVCMVLITVGVFVFSQLSSSDVIKPPTFQILSNILALASFIMTSFFSYLLVKHTDNVNNQNRKNNDEINARSESFRTLQFIASNYAVVDFVDRMLIYEVYKNYTKELKKTKNFKFYMREEHIALEDITKNFDNYVFLTVRIPIQAFSGGGSVASITFSNFHFHKEDVKHKFVPCSDERNSLVLYNKEEQRSEVVVNLVAEKQFWSSDTVNPFDKIQFNHTMNSLLGVQTSGWTEIYFVNPQKLEKDGANKYTINSSQFEISGLPKLSALVEYDIAGQVKHQ